jgi:hypothetical protein
VQQCSSGDKNDAYFGVYVYNSNTVLIHTFSTQTAACAGAAKQAKRSSAAKFLGVSKQAVSHLVDTGEEIDRKGNLYTSTPLTKY